MKIRDMIIKDLKIVFSDRSAILLLIIMPMLLMTILGFSLTLSFNDNPSLERIKIALVKEYDYKNEREELLEMVTANTDLEPGELDIDEVNLENIFFDDFLGNEEISKILEYELVSREEASQMLNNKNITAMVILPEGFIKDSMINFGTNFRNIVDIKVIGRSDTNIGTTIVEEIIRGFTDVLNYNVSASNSFTRLYYRLGIEEDIAEHIPIITERISEILANERPIIEYEALNDRPPMTSRAYYAFAMSAMFVLFSAGYGSKFLLEERDMKTYDRMSVSGVKQSTIVIGKAATIFLIILIQTIISFIFSTLVLGVEWGNILNLMLIFIVTAFSVSGLGIMLASIVYKSGSYNMGNVFTSFIVQVMALLGGSMIPLENMPNFTRYVSNLTPNGLMMRALTKNYYGYGFEEIGIYLLILLIIGLVFLVISLAILIRGRRGNHVKHSAIKADAY